jgi:uncharacterized membrane protein YcgQ (UPF0703/DUF1980 family)
MSKLNAILFNYQNTENQHSLIAMLKTYYPSFLMVLALICVLFMVIFTGIVERIMGESSISQIPVIVVCSLFIFPLVRIYVKEPMKKDSTFFEKKLGEEILKINKECMANSENIKFFMPEGIEINVQVNYDEPRQSESED